MRNIVHHSLPTLFIITCVGVILIISLILTIMQGTFHIEGGPAPLAKLRAPHLVDPAQNWAVITRNSKKFETDLLTYRPTNDTARCVESRVHN